MLCLSDGMTQFCSRYCSVASDCPDGDLCVGIGNGQGGCLPNSGSMESGGAEMSGGESAGASGAGVEAGASAGAEAGASMSAGQMTDPLAGDTQLGGGEDLSETGDSGNGAKLSSSCRASAGHPVTPWSALLWLSALSMVVSLRRRVRAS
jgi:hypothetical protein